MPGQDSFHLCPRCSSEFGSEVFHSETLICQYCGWTPSDSEIEASFQWSKRFASILVGLTVLLVVGFIHVVNWNQHSLTILPLKVKYLIGATSSDELLELADICEDRYKYECAESALEELKRSNPTVKYQIRLGNLNRRMGQHKKAISTYLEVLKNKDEKLTSSQKSDSYYGLAKSYEHLKMTDLAVLNYERSIKAKPEVIQITVTENYIKLLRRLGRSKHARMVIREARRRGNSKEFFAYLEAEKSI